MLQDKFPQLIRLNYNIKILVSASYKAKQSLAAKGLTPAIFLDRFYKERAQGPHEISYSFKQKQMRPLPQFVTIDIDEYNLLRKQDKDPSEDIDQQILSNKIMDVLSHQQLKYVRECDKSVFQDRASVQKFLNNQGFHWFEHCNKIYTHALSLGQENYRVNTSDQAQGVCYIVEVEKDKNPKDIFDKVKMQSDQLIRKMYQLNPEQIKGIKTMLLILFDVAEGCTVQQAMKYTSYFKDNTNVPSSLIYRLAINSQDLHDSIEWSRFNRPILHFNYSIKASDPVRIVAYAQFAKIQEIVTTHKDAIRKNIQNRLDDLTKKYEEINRPTKIFASFFKSTPSNQKSYNKEELDLRELADKMFILQDYKRAYDIYKNIASKMQKRNPNIENNLSQMIQLCLAMSKFHNIKIRSDPYNEIERYAQKIINYYEIRAKTRLKKYLIFLIYVFHTFRTFNRTFIRNKFYQTLKAAFTTPQLNIMPILIYEQFASLNLLYPNIDYRRFCYDLTRVATRYSQVKMYNYALRCYLIVEPIYRNSFPNIQKYQDVQLCHLFLETRNFRDSLKYLKSSWDVYVNRVQSQDLSKNQSQLVKHLQNYSKLIKDLEKLAPEQLYDITDPNLKIPVIHALNLQTREQMLENDQKSGRKWQSIGEDILDSKDFMSMGLNQRDFRNIVKSFDQGNPEEKILIYKFVSNNVSDREIKKNSRNAYVNEPLKLYFYMRNPLRIPIEVENIKLNIKPTINVKVQIQKDSVSIKPFKSEQIIFTITPNQPGFLQIQTIQWVFMKLKTEYRIKEPMQIKSQDSRSCFFKLNIYKSQGCLQGKAHFQDFYYEGEKGKMKIKLKNIGTQKISKVYIACGDEQLFGFKLTEINTQIQASQQKMFQFNITAPLVPNSVQSGEQKRICKLLILYKTGEKFRVCRTLNKFVVIRIARFDNFVCERLSNHLHLLSFSKKRHHQQNSGLEWMLIPGGFEIVKKQAAFLANQINYFFFIRKGNFPTAKFQFGNWAQEITSYPADFSKFQNISENNNQINIRFLWKKQNKSGYISKFNLPIIINEHGYLSSKFPINFKINYTKDITHNFNLLPYLEIPIQIKLKNTLYEQQLKIVVNFVDGGKADSSWQGTTQKTINLRMGMQVVLNVSYIVVRPGIYNLSKQIQYFISNGKGQKLALTHSSYEQIYLTVKGEQGAQNNKIDFEDAFKQFTTEDSRTVQIKPDFSDSLI